MTDRHDEDLPPLGERTPGRPPRSDRSHAWYGRTAVVGIAGVLIGLLLGWGLAELTREGGEPVAVDEAPSVETTVAPTTTTAVALPPECAEAIRSAEQSLTLLDRAFQTARRFDVVELDRMLTDLQEVRRSLTERVRACLERG